MKSNLLTDQRGYTLVELLVGLVISLLVGSVALTYMLSSSRTLANQSAEDVIQENARFALEILASSVRLAGSNTSRNLQTQTLSQGIFRDAICGGQCNQNNQAYTAGTAGKSRISATTDRAAFEYITNQGKTCSGQDITFEKQIVHVFYVAESGGVSSLYCQAYEASLDYVTQTFTDHKVSGPAVPLIDGVEMLQVQYGVDSDASADGVVDRYVNYTSLAANPTWFSRVKAVRMGLVLSNSQEPVGSIQNTEVKESRTYQVLDGTLTANDSVLRQTVSTTVFLPNSSSNI